MRPGFLESVVDAAKLGGLLDIGDSVRVQNAHGSSDTGLRGEVGVVVTGVRDDEGGLNVHTVHEIGDDGCQENDEEQHEHQRDASVVVES